MTTEGTHLRLALHRAWDEIAGRTFLHAAKPTLDAEEVREAVRNHLADEPTTDDAIKLLWVPLTEEQKGKVLELAFPHGPYMDRTDEGDEDFRSDILTD
jgi:hypothetical protein